jgi:hypothetical protein
MERAAKYYSSENKSCGIENDWNGHIGGVLWSIDIDCAEGMERLNHLEGTRISNAGPPMST